MYQIDFSQENRTVEVDAGVSIMAAAEKAGVFINSLCGGKGVCGKCRVQVKGGRVKADKHSISFLSREEIRDGYVLACQTKISSDMEVVIPPESRLEEEQILTDMPVVDYSHPEKVSVAKVPSDPMTLYEPMVQKVFLELKEPTPGDNIADIERVIRALREKTDHREFETSLECLQGLALKLRTNDWKVTVTIARHGEVWRIIQIECGDRSANNYGVAVDVGTTTVVAQLIHLKSGAVMGVTGSHNLQARYGEDVISRMIFACSADRGLNTLHEAVVSNINHLIDALTEEKGVDPEEITAVVAAGNTTMSHLLLSLIPCSIRLDPYVPTAYFYPQACAGDLDIKINPVGILETIPAVASYVGGDIVSGVLACGIADRPETKILIDVGTNGEIVVGNNEWLVCCSASAGPAFEGGGIKNGMRATRGAIERMTIEGDTLTFRTIGKAKAMGICGSGLIDCIYELVRHKIIGYDGRFNLASKNERVIEKDGETQFIVAHSGDTGSGTDLTITESDIGNIIRSKGAVFAAIKSLMDYVGLKMEDIHTFYVAGGFGTYLDIPRAIGIGLLPDIDPRKIQFVGNSSLMGARIALLSRHAFERTKVIAKMMTNIELSTYQPFMDEYIAAMFLPHTDRKLFPSVSY